MWIPIRAAVEVDNDWSFPKMTTLSGIKLVVGAPDLLIEPAEMRVAAARQRIGNTTKPTTNQQQTQ